MSSETHGNGDHPVAETPGTPPARRASPRVLIGAAAVIAAVVIAGIVIAVVGGGTSSAIDKAPEVGSLADAIPGAARIEALLAGIPQDGATLGRASAPVTVEEYVDVQCPYCRIAETEILPTVIRKYVRTGKVKVVLRMWAFIGADSTKGQAAVIAAGRQGKAYNMLELLFSQQGAENTGWLSDDVLVGAASSIPGLRVRTMLADRSSAAVRVEATNVDTIARRTIGSSNGSSKHMLLRMASVNG